jgi:hypothetical protein
VISGLPAILLPGGQFTRAQTIEQRIHSLCDIPASYSWSDFLAALNSYAEAHKTKILIAIDALNEAESSEIWRQALPGFIAYFKDSPWLVLVTTCRTTYLQPIWDNQGPANLVRTSGFRSGDLDEAITKYFDHYKLKADLTLAPLEQFRHPIYLKIFSESQNPERLLEKEVFLGQQTLFTVFDEFLTHVNKAVCRRLSQTALNPPGATSFGATRAHVLGYQRSPCAFRGCLYKT